MSSVNKANSAAVGISECWASSLGDCSGGISREHIISNSILQFFEKVRVHGLPWCQEPKDIGANSLTAKHLCKDHNARLSDSDSAALILFQELRDQFDPNASACGTPTQINGKNLERWFLKTGINMCLIGDKPVQWPLAYGVGLVPPALAAAAFGVNPLNKPCGLYFYAQHGHRTDSYDGVLFRTLTEEDDRILGFNYVFRGHPILLWLDSTSIETCVLPDGLSGSGFQYRTEGINLARGGSPFRSITLNWH